MDIRSLTDRFLRELQHKNPATVSNLRGIASFFNGEEEVTPTRVMDYVISRRSDGATPATINRELTIMKQLFRFAKLREYIAEDPTKSIRLESGMARRTRHITKEEELLLINCAVDWLQPIIQFAASTGMRRGEIVGLKKSDIDLENRCATIRTSKNGEPRVIPLSRRALEAVAKAMSITENVFGGKGGWQLRVANLEYNFRAAVRRSGLNDLRFHDLRHTFATRLVQSGADIYAVQRLLGHKSLEMTSRYAHHDVESLRRAIDIGINGIKPS